MSGHAVVSIFFRSYDYFDYAGPVLLVSEASEKVSSKAVAMIAGLLSPVGKHPGQSESARVWLRLAPSYTQREPLPVKSPVALLCPAPDVVQGLSAGRTAVQTASVLVSCTNSPPVER